MPTEESTRDLLQPHRPRPLPHRREGRSPETRLSREDGIALYASNDLLGIGQLADFARRRINGDRVYFMVNRHINPTNICRNRCKFCAFARDAGEPGAYEMTLDEVAKAVGRGRRRRRLRDPHRLAACTPTGATSSTSTWSRRTRAAVPDHVIVQAFTAVEIEHMAIISGKTTREVLADLQGGRPRRAARRRRRDLQRPHPHRRVGQEDQVRRVAAHPRRGARARHRHQLHDALRPHRDRRGARRPPDPAARAAGQDRRLPRVHPARLPPRQHRACRPAGHHRLRRPQDARHRAPDARQHPARQGVLDHARPQDRADLDRVRRRRPRRHRGRGAHHAHGRRDHARGALQGRPGRHDRGDRPRRRRARHALPDREDVRRRVRGRTAGTPGRSARRRSSACSRRIAGRRAPCRSPVSAISSS